MKKILLTQEALEKLNHELEELIVRRSEIAEEIKKARSFGDLSENAEYHAAREAQSLNETEILKVKGLLENYELVDTDAVAEDVISLNCEVEFKFDGDDEVEKVSVVTRVDADPMNNLISNESPIGEALIGHRAGDVVDCQTPNGVTKLEIMSVKHF
ncbi:transcription elongation factor GreA [Acidaminobacter sp. JC074]|uniref:transcription elongation factor GreA n=1 Tax=Acidaminobacter sp. JC074 TaxID=2530199 RepID=UPI001F0D5BA5|nr:transcription elongation factor GreA [Acidaminobacter sp. JC074]MCH4890364.1 transcription elongation factor GreA [Acidaminobacter sp. JC074]